MLYLYSKDKYGFEFCERFENEKELQKNCCENLPENSYYPIVSVVRPGEKDVWEADEDSAPNMRSIAACVEEAEQEGMQRPFFITCEGDCDYEAVQNEEDVDYYGLCRIWEDNGHYRIALRRYESGEISPEEADASGMYLLAEYIREDLGIVNDDEDEGEAEDE